MLQHLVNGIRNLRIDVAEPLKEAGGPFGLIAQRLLDSLDNQAVSADPEGLGALVQGREQAIRDVNRGRHEYIVEYI